MHIHVDRIFTTVARNLGLKDFSRYTNNWIEWSYEAEKLIGSKDTFVQKEATYTSTGAKATGSIEFTENPGQGTILRLNGVDLTFRSHGTAGFGRAPNEILRSSTLYITFSGIPDGVESKLGKQNNSSDERIASHHYPEALQMADYSFTGTQFTSQTIDITAADIGPKGNDYTLFTDASGTTTSGPTLTGGKGIYKNQQITLPDNMVKLLAVRVGTDDSDYEHASIKKTSAVHRGRVGKTTDDSQQRAFRYYVDGNRLNITHDDIDEITINYLAYPTDMRGWPMIKEGHETAVAQYIMWQMKLIEFYNGKLPQYITKELEKRWYFLCGKARGDDSMPTSEELKQIGNMWNTLVPITNDRSSLIDF